MRFTVLLALLGLVLSSPVVPAQPLSALQPALGFASGGAIGETAVFDVLGSRLSAAPFVVALGFGLGPSCMPTCLSPPLYVVKLGTLDSGGRGTARLSVPNAPALIGQTVFVEATIALSAPYFERPPLLAWIIPAPNAPRFQRVPVAAPMDPGHASAGFRDGTVLVCGGLIPPPANIPVATAALYDPTTVKGVPLPNMNKARYGHVACPLKDGTALIVGGDGSTTPTAELYNPATKSFLSLGPVPLATSFAAAAALTDLRTNREFVLIAGGFPPTDQAMLYDTKARTFSTLPRMTVTRGRVSAVSSPLGGVLLFGGEDSQQNVLDTVEVFEIYSRRFHPWGRMTGPRAWHDAVMLDGRFVLVVGGQTSQGARDDVEIFDTVAGVAVRWPSRLLQPRTVCTVAPRPGGGFAVFGSPYSVADATRSPELLTPGGSIPFRPIAELRGSPGLAVSAHGSVFAFFGGYTQFLQ